MKIVHDVGRNWHLQIPFSLWTYRTSIFTPIGATPYSPIYGSEVLLPLEFQISSLHVSLKYFIPNEEYRQDHLAQLELLDEKCLTTLKHHQVYQEPINRAYNKHVKECNFKIGDLVLKEN